MTHSCASWTFPPNLEFDFAIRSLAHFGNQIVPGFDGHVVDADHFVCGFQPVPFGRLPGHQLSDNGLENRLKPRQTHDLHQVRVDLLGRHRGQIEAPKFDRATLRLHFDIHDFLAQGMFQHRPAHVLPGGNFTFSQSDDQLTRHKLRARSGRIFERDTNDRTCARHPVHEQQPIQENRQQKIGHRPGQHDGKTPPDRLSIERPSNVLGRHRTFAFVEHLDVAAQRKCRQHPFGGVLSIGSSQQWSPEANRETQYLDPAQSGDKIMTELMKNDQGP